MRVHISVLILFLWVNLYSFSQIIPPYNTGFETNDPNWIHYPATNSIDEWQWGNASNSYAQPLSGNFAWCTNVNGYFNQGTYNLQSPSFDLSDTNNTYVISFYHKHNFVNSNFSRGMVEYSIDSGATWNILSVPSAVETENWHTTQSFYEGFFNTNSLWKRARASLYGLRGENDVKFRFKLYSPNLAGSFYGWIIDDFEIKILAKPDLREAGGSLVTGEPSNQPTFQVSLGYILDEEFTNYIGQYKVYHSLDNILDVGDLLLDSISYNFQLNASAIQYTVINTGFIQGGNNYIIYEYDVDDDIDELNETNNVGYAIIDAEPIYPFPYNENFESLDPFIKTFDCGGTSTSCPMPYATGAGHPQRISGSHSGKNSWYAESIFSNYGMVRRIEFPFMEVTDSNVIHLFYKNHLNGGTSLQRMYFWNNNTYWVSLPNGSIAQNQSSGWQYHICPIDSTMGPVFKFKIEANTNSAAIVIDDIYIGPNESDLLIDVDESVRNTTTNLLTDTLFYRLMNCGTRSAIATSTKFYYSTDSIWDIGDIYLGQNTELAMSPQSEAYLGFYYTKPSVAIGVYYIIASVDADSSQTEMREYNNEMLFKIYQNTIEIPPYLNDFETSISGWYHYSDYKDDAFFWGNATTSYPGISGKAFGVDSLVQKSADSRSLLYTPVFDLSGMTNPVMEFDLALSSQKYAWKQELNMTYSVDGGATWVLLDTTNLSFKRWYHWVDYEDNGGSDQVRLLQDQNGSLYTYYENKFPENEMYMGKNDDGTENCILDLNFLKNYTNVQFRYNYGLVYDDIDTKLYIDNFQISESYIDLTIDYVKDLFISDATTELELEYHIRNLGNYMSGATTLNLYLSADSLLDVGDVLVSASVPITEIGPDQRTWFFKLVNISAGLLVGKQYILFEIDNSNTVLENDELNNIAFYRINPGGIQSYACLENFDDYELHGWRSYNITNGNYYQRGYRYLNKKYSSREWWTNYALDGQMNLEYMNKINSGYPEIYLESPSYNFTNTDSVYVSFNFSLVTNETSQNSQEGARFEYSTDGGQNWLVMGAYSDPNGTNWYNKQAIGLLNNGPGWYNCSPNFYTAVYDASSIVGNQSDVTFRFHLNGKWHCNNPGDHGLKIDNFRVSDTIPAIDLVAINFGDTIEIENNGGWPILQDSLNFTFLNNGVLNATSSVSFFWSTDTILDFSDLAAGGVNFNSALAGDTISLLTMLAYPYSLCDSTVYLVYEINPLINNPSQPYAVVESDHNNNEGYYFVNLINHHLTMPATQLNYVNDTVLCQGDTIVLAPLTSIQNFSYLWSDGSIGNTLTVSDTGTYWVTITSNNGCSSITNDVFVQYLFNDVNLLVNGDTNFCSGDSVNLYFTELGTPNWSNSFLSDSSIYVVSSGIHWITLTNSNGCVSSDSVELIMDFGFKPIISAIDTIHYCQNMAVVEATMMYDSYNWNNGDTNRVTSFSTDGEYYLEVNNTCGVQSSDTLHAFFHSIIDSIIPGKETMGCLGDTIDFQVFATGGPVLQWYTNSSAVPFNIYQELFSFTGPLYPNIPIVPWQVTSNDPNYLSKVGMASGRLDVNPTGDSIVFVTDLIDVSNYYDIDLEVDFGSQIADSVIVYYEVDGGMRTRFETNSAVALTSSLLATQHIFEASTVKIYVVFDGISVLPSLNQIIDDVTVKGNVKQPQSMFSTGSNYSHFISGDYVFIITADNGFCVQEEIVVITASTSDLIYNNAVVCGNTDVTICPLGDFPTGYTVNWQNSSMIQSSDDSCVVINVPYDTTIVADIINEIGCVFQDVVYLYVNPIDTTVLINGNILGTNNWGTYQWLDCNNSYAPIIGQTTSSYIPSQGGSYAIEINQNGCIDTSECVTVNCVTPINLAVSSQNNVLTSLQIGATYQWLDCNGFVPLAGEVNQVFIPTNNGQYAVQITMGTCIDTSACINLTNVGINDGNFYNQFQVYPNPTNDIVTIDLGKSYVSSNFILKNVLGEEIIKLNNKDGNLVQIDLTHLVKGIYLLHILVEDQNTIVKIVKE